MGKKKAAASSADAKQRWLCYYCNTYSKDESSLIQHQAAKHFTCPFCTRNAFGRNCLSLAGLMTHVKRSHHKDLKAVPGAIEGRDSTDISVYGMSGVPEEVLDQEWATWEAEQAKVKEKQEEEEAEMAERRKKKDMEALELAKRKKEKEAREAEEASQAAADWALNRQKAEAEKRAEEDEKNPLMNLAANCGILKGGLGLSAQMAAAEKDRAVPPSMDKAPVMPVSGGSSSHSNLPKVGWGRVEKGGAGGPKQKRWLMRDVYDKYKPGKKVKIWCLVNNAHLNGTSGTIAPCIAKWPGTVEIQVQSGQWVQEFSIKMKNLELLEIEGENDAVPMLLRDRADPNDPYAQPLDGHPHSIQQDKDKDDKPNARGGSREDARNHRGGSREAARNPRGGSREDARNVRGGSREGGRIRGYDDPPPRARDDRDDGQRGAPPRGRDDSRARPPPREREPPPRVRAPAPRQDSRSPDPGPPMRGREPPMRDMRDRSRSPPMRDPPMRESRQRSSLPSLSPPRGAPQRADSREPASGYRRPPQRTLD